VTIAGRPVVVLRPEDAEREQQVARLTLAAVRDRKRAVLEHELAALNTKLARPVVFGGNGLQQRKQWQRRRRELVAELATIAGEASR